jgi:hypothetical protein
MVRNRVKVRCAARWDDTVIPLISSKLDKR